MCFREEESLVERFIFELLVVYVDSLALAHNDDKALGKGQIIKFENLENNFFIDMFLSLKGE